MEMAYTGWSPAVLHTERGMGEFLSASSGAFSAESATCFLAFYTSDRGEAEKGTLSNLYIFPFQ